MTSPYLLRTIRTLEQAQAEIRNRPWPNVDQGLGRFHWDSLNRLWVKTGDLASCYPS